MESPSRSQRRGARQAIRSGRAAPDPELRSYTRLRAGQAEQWTHKVQGDLRAARKKAFRAGLFFTLVGLAILLYGLNSGPLAAIIELA